MLGNCKSMKFGKRNVRIIRITSSVGEKKLSKDSYNHRDYYKNQTCCKWSHII